MAEVETISVVLKGSKVSCVINASDFDSAIHEKAAAKKAKTPEKPAAREKPVEEKEGVEASYEGEGSAEGDGDAPRRRRRRGSTE